MNPIYKSDVGVPTTPISFMVIGMEKIIVLAVNQIVREDWSGMLLVKNESGNNIAQFSLTELAAWWQGSN